MSIILSVYSKAAFKEYQLPSLNNADYSIPFHSDFFKIKRDFCLQLEVLKNRWYLKEDPSYKVKRNTSGRRGGVLEEGDIIEIFTQGMAEVTLIVKKVESVYYPYKKYRLTGVEQLTIGRDLSNDISYDYLRLVSKIHAVLERTPSGYKIVNKSRNGIYVDAMRINKEKTLAYGSYINIMGLHMVFLGNILAIDTIGSQAVVDSKKIEEYKRDPGNAKVFKQNVSQSPGKIIYHRSPGIYENLDTGEIQIESPPPLNKARKQPLLLTVGPAITMVIPMLLGCIMMAYTSNSLGGSSSIYVYSGLLMSISSAVIGAGWALANIRYQKKEEKEEEQHRMEVYSGYLEEKAEEIRRKHTKTTRKLLEIYPEAEYCIGYDESKGSLWNRNASHKDFLKHRLGLGNIPFQIPIQIPEKKFHLYQDQLNEKPEFIKGKYEMLYDVPVTLDFSRHHLIGMIGGKEKIGAIKVAKAISVQLAANNCYTHVKMGFIFDKNKVREEREWNYAKWLPHVWSQDRETRYLADNKKQASDVLYELAKIFRTREENQKLPYYILFVSDIAALEGELIGKYIFEQENIWGLTTFLLTERYEELPNTCSFVIENTEQFQGMYGVSASEGERQKISFDRVSNEKLENFARHLSGIQVLELEKGGEIPGSLTFFDMLEITRPSDLPIKELWAKNRTYENIRGILGQKAGGIPCCLDVHEKYHGPHGLIAGTTGSGKSETLQTYVLSLAVNYSPDDVGFFIIDYKGGGMANLFEGLPHMVGQISNLSGNQVKRAMISIKSENRRRQRIFAEHGVNSINLYTKLYKNGEAVCPVPHLFIIIDEFAELKREEPDFMGELISVTQVGRSLGIHLILATQKPNGTVDDNIWSNSRFRLCLRVQDKQDSNDMLHKPDAAYLTQTGRCYLQVGNDEVYELFQSGYSGAVYEEDVYMENVEIAKLLFLNGKVDMTGNSVKASRKKKVEYSWMELMIACLKEVQALTGYMVEDTLSDYNGQQFFVEQMYKVLERYGLDYKESKFHTVQMINLMQLYHQAEKKGMLAEQQMIFWILEQAAIQKLKLPQRKEKTQLEVMKEYLGQMAKENGYVHQMQLWMPVLEDKIYLEEFKEYTDTAYRNGIWPVQKITWSLDVVLGKMDDPANQNQMPLVINCAEEGHIAIIGTIVSGRSTMMQTMAYALISKYSPEMVNLYAIDFSSKMMAAFEEAPHFGGVIFEDQPDKIGKFFNMIMNLLEERKALFLGGNYSQYVEAHGVTLPAIIIFIDNYAAFKEKTEEAYEGCLLQLSKEGIGCGVFLVLSGSGFGIDDITSRVGENVNLVLCLELQDKFAYADMLHNNGIEVLPEKGIKGRGLARYGNRILEYQTALAVEAENDYQRMAKIKNLCREMKRNWKKKRARKIPEIPPNPVWSRFREMEEYRNASVNPSLLPVGYDASNAEVYGIDLSRTYCYIICGEARTGKTNFLRVCIQAAIDKESRVCVIDSPRKELSVYEKEERVTYVLEELEIFEFFKELLPKFQRRNAKKNQMLTEGMEEEEIFRKMSEEIPYFIFIPDFIWFVSFVYNTKVDMHGFLENIVDRGRLHHIYIISELALERRTVAAGYPIYESFTGYKTGIHFGGKVIDNPILNYDYMKSFQEKSRGEKPGIGRIPDVMSENVTEKVVVPLARK